MSVVRRSSRNRWRLDAERLFLLFLLIGFILNFLAHLARNFWSNESVDQISRERERQQNRQNETSQDDEQSNEYTNEHQLGERLGGAQINFLERRILNLAHHHRRKKNEQYRQAVAPASRRKTFFIDPHQKQSNRCDQPRRRRNRKPHEILASAAPWHCGQTIKSGQPQRSTNQIHRREKPTHLRMLDKHITKNNSLHQKRRRRPEGNQICERIKFTPERTLRAAHSRQAAIEQVENARQ